MFPALGFLLFCGCRTTEVHRAASGGAPTVIGEHSVELKAAIVRKVDLHYLLFLPEGYRAHSGKEWPLILFLHGSGERGTNIWLVAKHGPPEIVRQRADFPFVVVSPQCPKRQWWSNDSLLALLNYVEANYNVDTNRVYLTGLSMGGFGAYRLGLAYPERFAAMAPISGGGDASLVRIRAYQHPQALKTLAIWAFHGAKDPVVPLQGDEEMVDALKKAGCHEVKFTVYPDTGHDAWTETYNNPRLYQWFLAHAR